jgi:hypothetical protein
MSRVDDIEYMIACNELTAAQVFTQMRQLIPNKNIQAERDALQAAIFQFKENPISKNKFKMFDLIEGQG